MKVNTVGFYNAGLLLIAAYMLGGNIVCGAFALALLCISLYCCQRYSR
jgi:hypothetical protein